jgi:hypothetical protein
MASWSEVRGDDSVHLDKALRVPGGLEPTHASLPFTRWLMRVLGPVVQIPVLPVSHAGHHHSFRSGVASELVRNDHARVPTPCGAQQPAKETHGRESVTFRLHQDVENNAMLIDGSPEIVSNAIDLEKHLIQMPFVTGPRTSFPQARCESLPEFSHQRRTVS